MRCRALLPLMVASLFLCSVSAYAQATKTGTVRDTSVAVLPGVTVEAASPALIEKTRAQAAMMLVASGEGYYIGIASPFTQSHRVSGVAVVPLDEPDARVEVHIAWKKIDTSRAVREFVRSARAAFPPSAEAERSGAA